MTQFIITFNKDIPNVSDVLHRQHQNLPAGYGCKSVTFKTLWGWKLFVGAKNDDASRSLLATIGKTAWCGYRLIGPDGECWASDATQVPPFELSVLPRSIKRPQIPQGDAVRKGIPGVFEVSEHGEGWTHDITVPVAPGAFEGPTGFFAVDWRMDFLVNSSVEYHPSSPIGRIQVRHGIWSKTDVIFNR